MNVRDVPNVFNVFLSRYCSVYLLCGNGDELYDNMGLRLFVIPTAEGSRGNMDLRLFVMLSGVEAFVTLDGVYSPLIFHYFEFEQ